MVAVRYTFLRYHATARSQVYTEGLDICHPSTWAAVKSCPSAGDIADRRAREMTLYSEAGGGVECRRV